MSFFNKTRQSSESDQFSHLLQIIKDDDEINDRVIQLLKLDSFRRRNVLNRWLEQLQRDNASEKLLQALSFLFDNDIAKKVSTIINRNHVND